jgi:hypothetical protein
MFAMLRRTMMIAACLLPHAVSAQGGVAPPPTPLTVRGCEMVLHARNEGNNDLTIDLTASTAQPGNGPWQGVFGGHPGNLTSAQTFVVPANSTSISHTYKTWLDCGTKHKYKFTIRRNSKPSVVLEFPANGAYTTDVSLRLGDLSKVP